MTEYQVVLSGIAAVEIHSAFHRRLRLNELTKAQLNKALAELSLVITECLLVPVDEVVTTEAIRLVGSHALRSLDAIQLATAVSFFGDHALHFASVFVSSDRRLIEAATKEGLNCWNPEHESEPLL